MIAPQILTRPKKRRWLRRMLAILGIVILVLMIKFFLHLILPRNFRGSGEILPIQLTNSIYQTLYYNETAQPLGIVILGTGDGGWSYWEEKVAKHLMTKGYAVGGWDCRKFADSRTYDQAELAAGFRAAVAAVRKRAGLKKPVPVWYSGWSTGAEQSLAAATDPERPQELVGLLLAAPGEHGRYGITESDLLGVEPSGSNTFSLAELAPKLKGLRVVQFAAGLDPLDDTTWQESLGEIPHQLITLPNCFHDMGEAGEEFLQKFDEALKWTLPAPKK
jgi:pimeloyl-ACP methyl ester carboxylesterase